jgi:hypothetical protein
MHNTASDGLPRHLQEDILHVPESQLIVRSKSEEPLVVDALEKCFGEGATMYVTPEILFSSFRCARYHPRLTTVGVVARLVWQGRQWRGVQAALFNSWHVELVLRWSCE